MRSIGMESFMMRCWKFRPKMMKKDEDFGKLPSKGTLKTTRPPKRDRISIHFEDGWQISNEGKWHIGDHRRGPKRGPLGFES